MKVIGTGKGQYTRGKEYKDLPSSVVQRNVKIGNLEVLEEGTNEVDLSETTRRVKKSTEPNKENKEPNGLTEMESNATGEANVGGSEDLEQGTT